MEQNQAGVRRRWIVCVDDAVPLDPFDGMPLRYKPADQQVLIYSVGPDRMDNGGYRKADGNNFRDGTDIVFILRR